MKTQSEPMFSKYEVSHTQKRFWFMDQLDFSNDESIRSMSHVSAVFTLTGNLNERLFQKTVQDLMDRHQSLRTCFQEVNGTPVQVVFHNIDLPVPIKAVNQENPQLQLEQWIFKELNTPFDLQQPPLIRVLLYKLSNEKHVCLIMAHHSIADGLSVDIILAELITMYRANVASLPNPLPEPNLQYSDYAHWHNSLLNSEGELDNQRQYWLDTLAGELPDLNFPLDNQRPSISSYEGATVPLVIEGEWLEKLKKACEQMDVSLYMFLLGIMNVVLAKYTRNKDIIVGTSLSGRFHPDLNEVIGSFINTLPIRNQVEEDEPFNMFIQRIKQGVMDVQENQAYPFDKIVEDLGVERNSSRHPVYDVVFEMHTLHSDSKAVQEIAPGLVLSFEHSLNPIRYSPFDFAFELFHKEGKIEGYIQYATNLFEQDTMERLCRHFLKLVQQAIEDPSIHIGQMDMILDQERQQIMGEFNQLTLNFPVNVPFPMLFEEQVRRTPDRIAVSYEGTQLTYAELNENANRLANYLISQGIGATKFVAVMSERSIHWVTSLLAILKSGAAYVPIDPNLPDERATFVLNDCGTSCLISQGTMLERISGMKTKSILTVVCPEMPEKRQNDSVGIQELVTWQQLASFPANNPKKVKSADQLAYMIYTSGSTGTPKGALVRHNGMINHLYSKIFSLQLSERDIVGQNSSISFDVSIWQSLVALLVGGQTSIITFEAGRDQGMLINHLVSEKVTIIETVPSLLFAFLDTVKGMEERERRLPSLRWMIANGEELPEKLVTSWFDMFPNIPLINAYGPTECSDDVTQHVMHKHTQAKDVKTRTRVPIGRPLPNMRLYVVDQFNQLAPVGVKGEIWIAGIGVGGGYWNNEKLTKNKFVHNPFSCNPDEKTAYRTGDLGCWLSDGSLEFSSRIDYQVKVRGFRIELGEVEASVNRHDKVDEAAVIVKQRDIGESMLIAFYTSKEQLEANSLRAYLQEKLPYYMVPSQIINIDRMPLLTSEKIDRKMLQQWAEQKALSENRKSVLHTETERELSNIWKDILELKQVDGEDNFFHIGGHSIRAVKVVNRIRDRYKITMALQQIFITPVLSELAAAIDLEIAKQMQEGQSNETTAPQNPIRRFPKKEVYELAPVQLPEWYLHELEPENPFYNVSFDLMFYGEMNLKAFEKSWQDLIKRHSALRTNFLNKAGIPQQVVSQQLDFKMDDVYKDRKHVMEEVLEDDIHKTAYAHNNQVFDFEKGPLFSVELVEYSQKRFLMMFAAHHIIWDETSSMNLVSEFSELYNAHSQNRLPELPELQVEYTDYAEWMNSSIRDGFLEKQRQYWLNKFAEVPPALDLPTDYHRPPLVTFNGGTILDRIDTDLHEKITGYCQENGITLYMFLLSVLNLQLHRLSGQNRFTVGSPIVNRDDIKLENMIGLFATAIPLSCNIANNMTFAQLAEQSKQNAIEAYDNHLYPSNFIIEQIQTGGDLSRSKLFSVMYGLQNNKQKLLKSLHFDGLSYNPRIYDFIETSSRFDLSFAFDELDHGIEININYNSDLFKHSTAERIAKQFILLAKQVVARPELPLNQYELMSKKDKDKIIFEWNKTEKAYENQLCVHQLIERQAAITPNQQAVCKDGVSVSYKQLNEQANRMAHLLIKQGVKAEEKIGVTLNHSAELIISLLAIMKAGAAYVPISTELPWSRKLEIVESASISTIVTDSSHSTDLQKFKGILLELDKMQESLTAKSEENVKTQVNGNNLAYVLFTSGTTGTPKGIEIEHRGVVNLLSWLKEEYPLQVNDSMLFITPYSFDASLLEIFLPLSQGAKIVIPHSDELKNVTAIGRLALEHRVALLQFVPLLLEEFVNARRRNEIPELPKLRYVICGGAPLTRKIRDRYLEQFNCRLSNHYGPTEVTVDATVFDCSKEFEGEIVPIGKPLANTKMYVLDKLMNVLPVGVPGELYIQSVGIARGYLNDSDKTSESFVDNPFVNDPKSRLYKTGDIVKYTDEGNIQYIGRTDNQVKVRGNRVELEEVESVLLQNEAIGSAAVIHQKDEKHDGLIAYVELASNLQPFRRTNKLNMYTYSQVPQLQGWMSSLHRQAWPEYFIGDKVMLENWPKLYEKFSDYQFSLIEEDGNIVAVGNAIPIQWDGSLEQLPDGWDDGLIRGMELADKNAIPDTLLVLAGVVNEKHQGRGLASLLVKAFKHMAEGHGLKRIVVPVRPTGKTSHPELSFADYCSLTRKDGLPVDHWLRTHTRAGGKMLKIAERSQIIEGSIQEWEQWGQTTFSHTGSYHFKDTLNAVWIDLEKRSGIYHDPSIWVQHYLSVETAGSWSSVDADILLNGLKSKLPDYMVPQQIKFVMDMPLTSSGKIDKKALIMQEEVKHHSREVVLPDNQTEVAILHIWRDILQLEEIGVTENFFELGGHSLNATAVVARISSTFQCTLTLREMFEAATIRGLAKLIETKGNQSSSENGISFKKVDRRIRAKK
ncbi:amino acid adenylation domain-containing protein [Peribacillus simplex]|uniref:amino acid adenylation domain-containing protein n=1 Tax=Peribacillus simplex TaxID=1478 RepID=UPI003D273CBF